jgi:DNA helicase-2/ATP-dependent DNA helicase PcrA
VFVLSVKISTIFKKGEHARKVHYLLYVPSFEAPDSISAALAQIGNLDPAHARILGLDSHYLLETALRSDPESYLIPDARMPVGRALLAMAGSDVTLYAV